MRKNHKKKNNMFLILILMILGIGLGYALLSQDLTINGTTKVKGNDWSIYFDNIQITDGSVTLSTGDHDADLAENSDTVVEYTITLNTPGDFYEFTVDAVNDGTVDGMIGEIISKLNDTAISTTNPVPSYLDYSVTYEDGTPIAVNHLLAANTSETYKVRVEFKRDIEESDLPTTDQTNSFSFGVNYVQSDSNAIAVPHPIISTVYTINIYNENDKANTQVQLGQPIPAAITQYNSTQEVIAALNTLAGGTVAKPIYLKHTLYNDIVTETYVEFVVTESLATSNSGMTAGTYTLQGEKTCDWDPVNEEATNCSIENSEYYADNVTTLQTLFGTSRCTSYTKPQGYYYSCWADYLSPVVHSNGLVDVTDSNFDCFFSYNNGTSSCSGIPDIVE